MKDRLSHPQFPPQAPSDQDSGSRIDEVLVFRRRHVYMALLPLAFVAGIALGYLAWGTSPVATAPVAEPVSDPDEPNRIAVEVDDDAALGPEDAPVVIVEFSDFNCPYCQRFHQQTFGQIMETYQGQIRFVYRDFPVTSQESFVAAQAAECAGVQGAYWEYHDALFSGRYGLGTQAYRSYAQDLGLDADELVQCVEEGRYAQEVQADARYASELGVSGTPTFFINGIPLVGAQPFDRFAEVIEAELDS